MKNLIMLFSMAFLFVNCSNEDDSNSSNSINIEEGVSFDSNKILSINLEMDIDSYKKLQQESRFAVSTNNLAEIIQTIQTTIGQCNEPWPSDFNWYTANINLDGNLLHNIGIRKKGFFGSIFSNIPSFKIRTDKYIEKQKLNTTKRITLNNNAEDPSKILTCLSYDIFALANYPAPLANLASVHLNNTLLGTYTHVEDMKKPFLKRAFGNDNGSFYEGQFIDFNTQALNRWETQTKNTDDTMAPILKIAETLELPDDQLEMELAKYVNMERFMTFWALEVLIDHIDGYSSNKNNFLIYFDPNDNNRAIFIPWGVGSYDHINNTKNLDQYLNSELTRRISRIPNLYIKFENELQRLLDEVWNEKLLLSKIEHYSSQVNSIQTLPFHASKIENLKSWVVNRKQNIQNLIKKGMPIGTLESIACPSSF